MKELRMKKERKKKKKRKRDIIDRCIDRERE